jgi:phage protein D
VHGADRRTELGRQCFQFAWEGRASDAARQILESYGFTPDVQDTDRKYGRNTETLNQRATDLDFLKTIARENGFFVWLTYEASRSGPDPRGGSLNVVETAHFETSPFRALGPGGVPPSIASIQLAPSGTPAIRAGAGGDCANNVTSFEVREETERPNAASVTGVDAASVRQETTPVQDPQSPIAASGQTLTDVTGLQRTLCVTAPGNAEEARGRAEAALADAGWFVTARASTTAHMLGGVLQPHDIVEVQGIGSRHSTPFRVKSVTHVITPADHYMDLEMQSNAHLEK